MMTGGVVVLVGVRLKVNVGTDVCVAGGGRVFFTVVGKGVPVWKDAPGVRYKPIHAGWVRMDTSIGSMMPLERAVRKSLFGSRFDPILEFSFQLGVRRSAHPPASMMHRRPIRMMRMTMIQSRRLSFSRACMGSPVA